MVESTPPLDNLLVRLEPLTHARTVSLAAEKMWQNEIPVVAVVDDEKKYLGVVSIFTLLRSRAHGETKLKNLVEKAPLVQWPSDPVSIARIFARTGLPGLAVIEKGSIIGVVHARRVIYALKLAPKVPARHIMYPIEPLKPDDSVEKARKLIAEIGLRLVPVAHDGRLVGAVRVYDLVNFIYNTPLRRDKLGEVKGEVEYFLDQPVHKIMMSPQRTVNVDGIPTIEDIAEGAIVLDPKQNVVGVISPYLFIRRLLPEVEEAKLPIRIEGLDELDFIERNLVTRKTVDIAKSVAARANLLEFSVVLKPREKAGERRRYDVRVSIKLDKGSYSASTSGWDVVQAVFESLELAYKNFAKTKEKKRERVIDLARLRKRIGF